ncbi:GSCFA family protein [Catalinimonas alkaloidigena]|uniref:GSCFA family protein n=1 Tax=Catalinimonas alkaloidigena TaxID=1075417 RepID=A0A1G8ZWH0_9BACT|nr:GSCFA domain-containing protein [Catalinimonas alkaloidigena]SDK19489.1 GSCFA family protein [Catalinimonas alkaloidigena]
MHFRTELPVSPASFRIQLADPLLSLGSCFADRLGQRLHDYKFQVLHNPFGIVYNPLSLHRLLQLAAHRQPFAEAGYLEREGQWFHYDAHSEVTAGSREALAQRLTETVAQMHHWLRQTRVLLLTWGTAFVYQRVDTPAIVANCHKLPARQFRKELLSVDRIVDDATATLQAARRLAPDLEVILTVSPVRHVKDTLPLNSVSKATLRLAAHQLQERHPYVTYFPSYELLIDDLRDYRFYGSDLLHPTEMAEAYVWEKFDQTFLSESALAFVKEWEGIRRALAHRPFQPDSPAHQQFLRSLHTKLQSLAHAVDVSTELHHIGQQLH